MSGTKIGLGLAAIGRPEYINIRQEVDKNKSIDLYKKNAFSIFDFAYSKGIRHFDTAPSYGKGEEFLEQWYNKNSYPDLRLSTKWGYTYVADWNLGYKNPHEIKEHTLSKLNEQWSVSKHLLPALKIYQIHSATFESKVLENSEVLDKLYEIKNKTGLTQGISVSGERQNEVLKFASEIKINGELLFESFQVTYNLLDTSTYAILKKLIERGNTVIVKEALANGRIFNNPDYIQYKGMYTVLEQMADKYKVSVDAIALRFVMDRLRPSIVLSGASTTGQLSDNLKANDFQLEESDLISLDKYSVDSGHYWKERKALRWN